MKTFYEVKYIEKALELKTPVIKRYLFSTKREALHFAWTIADATGAENDCPKKIIKGQVLSVWEYASLVTPIRCVLVVLCTISLSKAEEAIKAWNNDTGKRYDHDLKCLKNIYRR